MRADRFGQLRAWLGVTAVFALVGCTKQCSKTPESNANEIVVGQFGSFTGNEASFGLSTDKGIRLAVDEKNAAGGIKGRTIRLITEDNQGKDDEAAAIAKKLVTQDKVIALLGEVASNRSRAAAPIAQQFGVPMITPSATNPKVTAIGDYIFRVCFIDPFQGPVMAKFVVEHLKMKKVAIFKDLSSDYSLGLTEYFTKSFKELGGEIVAEVTFQRNDTDFKAQLTQIRGHNPEGIFIPGYYGEVALIARQAKQLGIKAVLLGGDGWDSPKLFEIGKDAIDGAYFSNHYSSESTSPATQEFLKKYKAKYNEEPDSLAAAGYDAALVLIAAMERAPELTSKAIRDEIAKTKDFQGATGTITLNAERNADKEAYVVQVKGKTLKLISALKP